MYTPYNRDIIPHAKGRRVFICQHKAAFHNLAFSLSKKTGKVDGGLLHGEERLERTRLAQEGISQEIQGDGYE